MSSIPREALNTNASKAGRDRGSEFEAQRFGTRNHFIRIGNVGRRDLVHHFGGRIAQHALGADIEDLDDALRVGGNTREIGAVENRALQAPALSSVSSASLRAVLSVPSETPICDLGSAFLLVMVLPPGTCTRPTSADI